MPMFVQDSPRRLFWGTLLVRIRAGRFAKIGIPLPQFTGPFVGVVEIVCGALLLVGLLTTFAVVPLLIDIAVAIATTKIPMLLKQGFWAAMHEGRTDFCMFVGLIAIALLGAGGLSLDERWRRIR
jgi:uncharacterized membrane protein YphA (DoxX/SURF4 family)